MDLQQYIQGKQYCGGLAGRPVPKSTSFTDGSSQVEPHDEVEIAVLLYVQQLAIVDREVFIEDVPEKIPRMCHVDRSTEMCEAWFF